MQNDAVICCEYNNHFKLLHSQTHTHKYNKLLFELIFMIWLVISYLSNVNYAYVFVYSVWWIKIYIYIYLYIYLLCIYIFDEISIFFYSYNLAGKNLCMLSEYLISFITSVGVK